MEHPTVSIHLGVHFTDEGQLVASLKKNDRIFSEHGVLVPPTSETRRIVRAVLKKLDDATPSVYTQDVLFELIGGSSEFSRLVLSDDLFLSNHPFAFNKGVLYRNAGANSARLRNLFPESPVEFFLAVRNPASFLLAFHHHVQRESFAELCTKIDPDTVAWSYVLREILEHNPGTPITVWRHEDTPFIWPEVLHRISGVSSDVQLLGGLDFFRSAISKEGMKRLRVYLAKHPTASETQRRRVLAAFRRQYAAEKTKRSSSLLRFDEELFRSLSAVYEDDLFEIARLPGVNLLRF